MKEVYMVIFRDNTPGLCPDPKIPHRIFTTAEAAAECMKECQKVDVKEFNDTTYWIQAFDLEEEA